MPVDPPTPSRQLHRDPRFNGALCDSNVSTLKDGLCRPTNAYRGLPRGGMKLPHQKITHGQPALGVVKQLWGNTSGFSVKNDPHQRRRRIGIRLDTINRQGEIAHVVTAFETLIGAVTFTIE